MPITKKVLLIAFDFTPSLSSGVERVLKFARHLQTLGWQPIVLTVHESTYENVNAEYTKEEFKVYRTFCLDVGKHLAYKGRYFGWMKQPDRYWGWCFTAIPKGVQLVRQYKVDAIFSSYPILTSHMVAGTIAKWTKKPWIADYRDPLQCYYHKEVYTASKVQRLIDRWVIKNCDKATFATQKAADLYKKTHPNIDESKFISIYNGVDSSNFSDAKVEKKESRFVLLHAGSLYASGRDPMLLFKALVALKEQGFIKPREFVVRLIGENNETLYNPQVSALGLNKLVEFLPSISYQECLIEMQKADALLVVQGNIFYSQIPGKLYEYFATNKIILGITNQGSETAKLLNKEQGCFQGDTVNDVFKGLLAIINNNSPVNRNIEKYERKHRAAELAALLNNVTNN